MKEERIKYHVKEIERLSNIYSNSTSPAASSLLTTIQFHREKIEELEKRLVRRNNE